jgi:uncharacterized protein YijF (DUF1287 family)
VSAPPLRTGLVTPPAPQSERLAPAGSTAVRAPELARPAHPLPPAVARSRPAEEIVRPVGVPREHVAALAPPAVLPARAAPDAAAATEPLLAKPRAAALLIARTPPIARTPIAVSERIAALPAETAMGPAWWAPGARLVATVEAPPGSAEPTRVAFAPIAPAATATSPAPPLLGARAPGQLAAAPLPKWALACLELPEPQWQPRGIILRHPPQVCEAPPRGPPRSAPPETTDPTMFGARLAAAAAAQVGDFVVYTDQYRTIRYPMGDVPPLYGVCTDVVVRAYRALGLDLQMLVHVANGHGDTNIDHRRVDTLRRFFAGHGESLPISAIAEDYRAGDIVTYWRPQNRHTHTHIAVVADRIGPSGRPMIIHNRGWGPQIEDALFVDEITGHYRYNGAPKVGIVAAAPASAAAATVAKAPAAAPASKPALCAAKPGRSPAATCAPRPPRRDARTAALPTP